MDLTNMGSSPEQVNDKHLGFHQITKQIRTGGSGLSLPSILEISIPKRKVFAICSKLSQMWVERFTND